MIGFGIVDVDVVVVVDELEVIVIDAIEAVIVDIVSVCNDVSEEGWRASCRRGCPC